MTNEQLKEKIIEISGTNPKKCMKCGKCSASCPAFSEMDIHPHKIVSMVAKGEIDELRKCKTLWMCLSCFACVERCPRTVEPTNLIEAIRVSVIREQGNNHLKAEDVAKIDDDNIPQQAIVSAYRKYSK